VDFVPQVDTTMNVSATAMGQDFGWGEAVAYGDCYGQGRFRVVANPALPNVTTGVLTSSLYLVATGGDTDCGYLGMTSLGAGAGGSSADAYGDGGGFMVYAYLSNANGSDEEIFDFVPGAGLNNLYVGTENTGIGATHSVWAYIDCYYDGAYACTDGGSLWGFSASAWYAIY
jgi:hypothetical protein